MKEKKTKWEMDRNSMLLFSILAIVSLLFLFFIAFLIFFISTYPDTVRENEAVENNFQSVLEENKENFLEISNEDPEVGGVVEKVSEHMLLPGGEYVVATVNDPAGLQETVPGAFTYAKQGDILLFYPNGMIIYDPVVDKIMDVIRLWAPIEEILGENQL